MMFLRRILHELTWAAHCLAKRYRRAADWLREFYDDCGRAGIGL